MMATVTSNSTVKSPMSLRRKIGYAVTALAVLVLLWLVFNFDSIKAQARLGASYGAHVACSCRYIESRPLASCKKDFEPGMELVSLTDDPQNRRVTASVPLLAKAMAERRGDFGCLQLTENEIDKI
ncbi:MAG: hypothetical protein ACRCY3_01950 [Sphingorhabdus sp.]